MEETSPRKRPIPPSPKGGSKAVTALRAGWPNAWTAVRPAPLVLLVDDLADQRTMYQEYLEYGGFSVIVAASAPEGIAKAIDLVPDVIVMDLSMPGIDGFEATKVLKAISQTRHIPVVAFTAHSPHLPREWAVAAGCDGYLQKPLLPHDLAEHIVALLKTRWGS
jgi:two-component system cell cycle response regulator DivK